MSTSDFSLLGIAHRFPTEEAANDAPEHRVMLRSAIRRWERGLRQILRMSSSGARHTRRMSNDRHNHRRG